ncbi:glycosyltransferase family 2 protein [Flavobacterium sp. CS20]|jgi:glycosyltransferase involved in cell wall biosynthesis|uniref:glycosyltransferase n=1 Tax=Flavobacterium sp. CS20 TaxID=2775246 RepID=UPI001B3A4F3C|nr:glycosyltransferase family 2 protein [Flavobacterium sp. CS20]QTY27469.1 glycosyltransferase family 2 protein [Flavobacterium sp. CS20]
MQNVAKHLKFAVIIPAYNEEEHLSKCLKSLLNQTLKPHTIVVVDDSSTDNTGEIIKAFENKNTIITSIYQASETKHLPGQKVINAFKKGLNSLNLNDFDIICKFDADLIFPSHYLEEINKAFVSDKKIGLCGGVCSVENSGRWQTEKLTNLDHIRGALKAYRVEAFKDIGGLPSQMGWDTADEFKLRYKKWKINVLHNLPVKHLKPTATSYQDSYFKKQGQVFYALRYSFLLTLIASLKIAKQRNQLSKFKVVLNSYLKSKNKKLNFLLSREEGQYLRHYRWNQIWRKLRP